MSDSVSGVAFRVLAAACSAAESDDLSPEAPASAAPLDSELAECPQPIAIAAHTKTASRGGFHAGFLDGPRIILPTCAANTLPISARFGTSIIPVGPPCRASY